MEERLIINCSNLLQHRKTKIIFPVLTDRKRMDTVRVTSVKDCYSFAVSIIVQFVSSTSHRITGALNSSPKFNIPLGYTLKTFPI
jgi:hypothetical protein